MLLVTYVFYRNIGSQNLSSVYCPASVKISMGETAMDDEVGIRLGRPFGGVAVMWRKSLGTVNVKRYNDSRLIGIEIRHSGGILFILNVYMPTQSRDNYHDFLEYLQKIQYCIEEAPTNSVMVIGDWNADITSNSNFGNELFRFCEYNNYVSSDINLLDTGNQRIFTYYSEAHQSTSWLDHCISTSPAHNCITDISILHEYIGSDHFPLRVTCSLDYLQKYVIEPPCQTSSIHKIIDWSCIDDTSLHRYRICSKHKLSNVSFDHQAVACRDPNCNDTSHLNSIDKLYNDITVALEAATAESLPTKSKGNSHNIPGWNQHIKDYHSIARDAFLMWRDNGSPRQGPIFELMKKTRAKFKYALKICKANEIHIRADGLAKNLSDGNIKHFWKGVTNKRTMPLSSSVGECTGHQNIANMWRSHFASLFSSVNNCDNEHFVKSNISNVCYSEDMIVRSIDILNCIDKLSNGKAAGPDGLTSEHIKYADNRLHVLLSVLFTAAHVHGHLPLRMLDTILVPIVKNKTGDVTDVGNYRPIASATAISKLYELLILSRCEQYFVTSDHQFGFKAGHSTDMSIFLLKK